MINRDISTLEPKFHEKVRLWLDKNPTVFITESRRSYTRQLWLYAQGRTRLGEIVTWTLQSHHTLGLAVDIAFEGTDLYPSSWNKWRVLADSAKEYGIDWGYDMWGIDKPHFQDNGQPLNPPMKEFTIPEWAEESCKKAKEKGIITKDFDEPITAYRLCAILDNLGLLD